MSVELRRIAMDEDADTIRGSLATPEVFADIFDGHWDSICRYCRSRAGDAGEDLAAETFRLAFDRRRTYDLNRPDARPWLLGLATNLIRNHLRHSYRGERALRRLTIRNEADHADAAIGRAEAALLRPDLAHALNGIAAESRDTLLLMAWNDLSYQEVADALDIPIGTVRSRISRARLQLRTQLADLEARG